MTDAVETGAGGRRARPRAWAPIAFALAALVACWNPVAAPLGLVVGAAAAVLGWKALRRGGGAGAAAAVGMGVLAAVASGIVLALTAGAIGVDLPGQPVVKGRTPAELQEVLAGAEERTRDRRERAAAELDKVTPPADGGTPRATRPSGRAGVPSQRGEKER